MDAAQELDQPAAAVAVAVPEEHDGLVASLSVAPPAHLLAASAPTQLHARHTVAGCAGAADQAELASADVQVAVALAPTVDDTGLRTAATAADLAGNRLHAFALADTVTVDRDNKSASLAVAASVTLAAAGTVADCNRKG